MSKLKSSSEDLILEADGSYRVILKEGSTSLPSTGEDGQSIMSDGSQWVYDSSQSAVDNGGTVVNGWVREKEGFVAAAPPVSGAFLVGDVCWNSSPTAGGNIGWVCTTAGTPGTWKAFGTIAA